MGNLKNTLIKALEGDDRSTNILCERFKNMAVAYLKTKAKRNHLLLNLLYKNFQDLALDCIADLFNKKEGRLESLHIYFESVDIETMKEPELQTLVRRLVFSKVNEGLYRNYKSFDPSLSKIIRNVKRTIDEEKVAGVAYSSDRGMIEVEPVNYELPVMPEEVLEGKLSSQLSEMQNCVDAVQKLKEIFDRQNEYASAIQLVAFAILYRKIFASQLEMDEEVSFRITKKYNQEEIKRFIEESILKEREALQKTYVDSGKMSRQMFDKYLKVAEAQLEAEYAKKSPLEGYFEQFTFFFPELTYERYRSHHRKIIEYMIKKIRVELIARIKEEENFSRSSRLR